MNVVPLNAVASNPDELRVSIRSRATALLNLLGSGGREVLSKMDTKLLVEIVMHNRPARPFDAENFASFEIRLRREYGTGTVRTVTRDGVIVSQDPRERVRLKMAKATKPTPVTNERDWRVPVTRPTGPNIVDFTKRRRVAIADQGPNRAA